MPFCVAGMGDLLALFRCISCRFNFAADPARLNALGAPGRVFVSGEPELACNVQSYPHGAYLRQAEAAQCRVQSSMLLPVFMHPPKQPVDIHSNSALAVIEVVQTSDDMAFLPVAHLLGIVLLKCGLFTSLQSQVSSRIPTAATALDLPLQTGLLEVEASHQGTGSEMSAGVDKGAGNKYGGAERSAPAIEAINENLHAERIEARGVRFHSDKDLNGAEGSSDDSGSLDDKLRRTTHREVRDGPGAQSGGHVARNKAGVALTLADLQGQFGVGLKEAANSLGVCTTTLKRACRRHGIQRWPRRALAKVSRALDEMERRGGLGELTAGIVPANVLDNGLLQRTQTAPSMVAKSGPLDGRWTTLASMIPPTHADPFQSSLQHIPAWLAPAVGGTSQSDVSLEGAVAMQGNNGFPPTGPQRATWAHPGVAGAAVGRVSPMGTGSTSPSLVGLPSVRVVPATQNPLAVVPAFLKPNGPMDRRAGLESPFAPLIDGNGHSLKPEAVAAVPSEGRMAAGELPVGRPVPGQGPVATADPAFSLPNFSQMSVPSLNLSLFQSLPGMGIDQHNQNGVAGRRDDVGLLDSTILELMLSEDSRSLVGATDDDLKRLFGGVMGHGQKSAR